MFFGSPTNITFLSHVSPVVVFLFSPTSWTFSLLIHSPGPSACFLVIFLSSFRYLQLWLWPWQKSRTTAGRDSSECKWWQECGQHWLVCPVSPVSGSQSNGSGERFSQRFPQEASGSLVWWCHYYLICWLWLECLRATGWSHWGDVMEIMGGFLRKQCTLTVNSLLERLY